MSQWGLFVNAIGLALGAIRMLSAFANGGRVIYPALFGLLLAMTASFSLSFIMAGPPALLVGLLFFLHK